MRAELYAQHRKALAAARQVMTSEHHSAQERLRSNIAKREEQAAQNVAALEAATSKPETAERDSAGGLQGTIWFYTESQKLLAHPST